MQIKHGFEELKAEVKNELIANNVVAGMSTIQSNQSKASAAATNNEKNIGLMDVDMLDVADLEKERGDPNDHQIAAAKAEQDELAKARLQRQALTFEQKCLIEKIIEDKQAIFTHSIKNQFNSLHLELIKNFQKQESELRGVLMHVAYRNL